MLLVYTYSSKFEYHVNFLNTGKFPPLSLFANLKVSPISTWISLLRKEVVVCTIFNQRKQRSYFEMWGSFRVVEEMFREITAWQIHGYGSLRSHPALSAEGPAQEGAALSATYVYWSRKKWKTLLELVIKEGSNIFAQKCRSIVCTRIVFRIVMFGQNSIWFSPFCFCIHVYEPVSCPSDIYFHLYNIHLCILLFIILRRQNINFDDIETGI